MSGTARKPISYLRPMCQAGFMSKAIASIGLRKRASPAVTNGGRLTAPAKDHGTRFGKICKWLISNPFFPEGHRVSLSVLDQLPAVTSPARPVFDAPLSPG
jgi:hypothetical protein